MFHISNIIILKSNYLTYFHPILKHWIFFWNNSFNSAKMCCTKETHLNYHQCTVQNWDVNNQKIFEQIHLYTILIQAISTIFTDQMTTYLSISLLTNKINYWSKKHNHDITILICFSTSVPSSGGVLSHVTFKNHSSQCSFFTKKLHWLLGFLKRMCLNTPPQDGV